MSNDIVHSTPFSAAVRNNMKDQLVSGSPLDLAKWQSEVSKQQLHAASMSAAMLGQGLLPSAFQQPAPPPPFDPSSLPDDQKLVVYGVEGSAGGIFDALTPYRIMSMTIPVNGAGVGGNISKVQVPMSGWFTSEAKAREWVSAKRREKLRELAGAVCEGLTKLAMEEGLLDTPELNLTDAMRNYLLETNV